MQRAAGNLPTLLLLHGRGGFEHDLLGLAAMVAPGWGVIAPHGPEREGNGFVWFRHQAVGVPVIESLDVRLRETAEVAAGLARDGGVHLPMVAVGFSNGGMMAGALGCARPDLVGGVVLLSSTYPLPSHIYDMGGLSGTPPPGAREWCRRLPPARGARGRRGGVFGGRRRRDRSRGPGRGAWGEHGTGSFAGNMA